MKTVLVIGGGFGGLSAARKLCAYPSTKVILIDKKTTVDFLPLLPDTLGRGINPDVLLCDLRLLARRWGFVFLQEEVTAVDFEKKEVATNMQRLPYDYLVIASGSETNFYGNAAIEKYAYKLDSVDDAIKIISTLKNCGFENYIIGGGGYTGVEVATNLRVFLKKNNRQGKIIIAERAPTILGPLPAWMKEYVLSNLKQMDIEVAVNTTIAALDEQQTTLSDGRVLSNSMVIWAAGVKTSVFIQNLKAEKNPQGRLKVDTYLRINECCFAIGDTAYVTYQGNFLRMAVQFAITEGECAAGNILKLLKEKPLQEFWPQDLGYVIPMANNVSCGHVLGADLKGRLPTVLHFLMCFYRSFGLRNKFGIIKELIKGGGIW